MVYEFWHQSGKDGHFIVGKDEHRMYWFILLLMSIGDEQISLNNLNKDIPKL